jgi:hypothetical protein
MIQMMFDMMLSLGPLPVGSISHDSTSWQTR